MSSRNPSDYMLHPRFFLVLVQKTENASSDIDEQTEEVGTLGQGIDRIREIHVLRMIILLSLWTSYFTLLFLGIIFALLIKENEDGHVTPGGPLLVAAASLRLIMFLCINYVWGIGDRLRARFYKYCNHVLTIVLETLSNAYIIASVMAATALICGLVAFVLILVMFCEKRMAKNKGYVISIFVLCAVAVLSLLVKGVPLRIYELMGYVRVPPIIEV